MDDLVYFYPTGHQAHAQDGHPERPERVEAIRQSLEQIGWWEKYLKIEPVSIPDEVLFRIHDPQYAARVREVSNQGQWFDMDTYSTHASYDLALKAAGGGVAVAERVWEREARRGFALTRPPGHHATPSRAMGFCLLNNIAIAAEYLLQVKGASRLAIIDLDLHHGNGTERIFYNRGDVFYISTHQSPLYPGTGELRDTGSGEGEGFNANFPLPPFSGDRAFKTIMDELIVPLLFNFKPEMILVSYGFDTHWRDPLGSLLLSARVYGDLIALLSSWADQFCDGRIALFLEGGYDIDAAKICSQAVTAAMLGQEWEDILGSAPNPENSQWEGMVRQAIKLWRL
ncbi:MAG: histone deacetylase [Anaerolineales bacterium]|nr:histone deacetylase [Anaerolineales bacterium]